MSGRILPQELSHMVHLVLGYMCVPRGGYQSDMPRVDGPHLQ